MSVVEMALLTGKTAVITGGATGIALATAMRFVDEGAPPQHTSMPASRTIERVSHRSSQVCVVTTFVKNDRPVSRLWL